MFADAKKEGCGIAWELKLLCRTNEDCSELVPSTGTTFGAFNLVGKLVVVRCVTFFTNVVGIKQTYMSSSFADLLPAQLCYERFCSYVIKLPRGACFRTEWLAISVASHKPVDRPFELL